jgi:uncharacterized protein (TIGR03435 family)
MLRQRFQFAALLACCGLFGQAETPPSFEVAAIRSLGRAMPSQKVIGPERFDMAGPVKSFVQWAYDVEGFQVNDGPDWFESDRYEIVAKTDHAADAGEFKRMLRSLLEDRFQLKFHRQTKEMAVQVLKIGKNGPKLSRVEGVELKPVELPAGALLGGCGFILGSRAGADMGSLVRFLKIQLGQIVVDETGLSGDYDFRGLRWDPGSAASRCPADDSRSLVDALEQQLGLRLESRKGPVEVLIIDRIERPSEN